MNILIVSQYFWPESFRVNDLATGLCERGHTVTVLTGQPNYETGSFYKGYSAFSPRFETVGGVRVARFPIISRGRGTGLRLALNYSSFAVSSTLLAPFRLREPFDVVLVYQMSPVTMAAPAFVFKRLRSVPVVFWVQDLWPETLRATGKITSVHVLRQLRGVVNSMYRASEHVLVQSKAFIPEVRKAAVPDHRIQYFPNWAETVYRPVTVERDSPEQAEMPTGFRIMFAGNIGLAHSVETIVDAAALLRDAPNIRWVVVGDGRRRQWAQDRVAALGLEDQVRFLGRRSVEVMPRYFALADVLLVTLRRDAIYALTVPSKLQSYLASARPVIGAIDGEGARVIEESRAGLTCPSQDPRALADAVLMMSRMSPEERAEMGRQGRAYFEDHFERDMLIDRMEGLLHEVVQRRRAGGLGATAALPSGRERTGGPQPPASE